MIQEPNENFGHENLYFQPDNDGINSETMENTDPGVNQHEVDTSDSVLEEDSGRSTSRNAGDRNLDSDFQKEFEPGDYDMDDELDDELDNDLAGRDDYSDDDVNQKDKSDY